MKTFLELLRDSAFAIVFHLAPRFANVLLFILLGRLAGPEDAGIFTLGATYLLIFTTIMRGLDDLLVRQIAREPQVVGAYFTNFLILRFTLAITLYFLLVGFVVGLFDYSAQTTVFILVLCLSLVPDAITNVAQAVLMGQRRFSQPALVLGVVNLLRLAGGAAILTITADLVQIAQIWVAASVLAMVLMFWFAIKSIGGIRRLHGRNWAFLQTHKQVILVFFLITLLTTLESQTDTIMLSAFHDEKEVGWYGAATTLAYTLIMMSQAYRFAVYPLMSHYHIHTPNQVSSLYQQSLRFLGMLALPIVVGTIIMAAPIVEFIFGSQFAPSAPVLSILIFVFLLITLNEPTTRVLLVNDQQNTIISFLVVSVVVNVLLNLLFTPTYGSIGAAVARVSSTAVLFFASFIYVRRHYYPTSLHALLTKSALAALVMGVVVFFLKEAPLLITITTGAIIYIGLLFLLRELKPSDLSSIWHTISQRLTSKPQN